MISKKIRIADTTELCDYTNEERKKVQKKTDEAADEAAKDHCANGNSKCDEQNSQCVPENTSREHTFTISKEESVPANPQAGTQAEYRCFLLCEVKLETNCKCSKIKAQQTSSSKIAITTSKNPNVKLGSTLISAVYEKTSLIGVVDSKKNLIFVSPDYSDKVRNLFHAKLSSKDTWQVNHPENIKGTFQVCDIEKLDWNHTNVEEKCYYALKDAMCTPFMKGTCINFFSADGTFAYSWEVIRDTEMCAWGNDYCAETWQTNQETLYPLPGCNGVSYTATKTWAFCVFT